MWLSTAAKYLSLTWEMKKTTILSAMEFRTSFLTQVLGMVANDAAFTVLWVIFFQRFNTIRGWGFAETGLLIAVSTLSFGLTFTIAGGSFDLAKMIRQGELDHYMSLPKNVLWHLVVSRTRMDAIGDILYSVAIFFIATGGGLLQFLLFVLVTVLASCIMFSFVVITQSIAFYVSSFEEAAKDVFEGLLSLGFYPQNIYSGALKFTTIFIIPAFFTATVPIRLLQHFSWLYFGVMAGAAALALTLAVTFFNISLRRYESGNLIGVRM